jgi:hypothetical protein
MSLKTKDELWTMADGTEIWVREMSESHAKNALRLMIRRARGRGLDRDTLDLMDEINFYNRGGFFDNPGL